MVIEKKRHNLIAITRLTKLHNYKINVLVINILESKYWIKNKIIGLTDNTAGLSDVTTDL